MESGGGGGEGAKASCREPAEAWRARKRAEDSTRLQMKEEERRGMHRSPAQQLQTGLVGPWLGPS